MRKRGVVIVSMGLFLLLMPSIKVKASEETPSQLYDKAVNENIINPNIYPKVQWEKDESTKMRPSYDVFKKEISESTSYPEWLEMNNYGVMADTKAPILQGKG